MTFMKICAIPGTAMEISESRVKKDMSFIEPKTKFREKLIINLRKIFLGISII
jgi:hypothetical protein